jgi:predicted DNA-binding ribbon-helix-helix protein
MCEYFAAADPMLYESRRRSLRIHGVSTSLRLENHVWDVLAGIAADMGCSTNVLLGKLYDELSARHGDVSNFASFLRVTCLRHLARAPEAKANVTDRVVSKGDPSAASTRH